MVKTAREDLFRTLHETADEKNDRLVSLVHARPDAVRTPDEQGRIALHVACQTSRPLASIRLLLEAWPESIKVPDSMGRLPLFHACEAQAPHTILWYLFQKWPDAAMIPNNWDGALPLHALCRQSKTSMENVRMLIDSFPQAVEVADKSGRLPIHYAIKGKRHSLVKALIEKCPSSLMIRSNDGTIPLHVACRCNQLSFSVIETILQESPLSTRAKDQWEMLPLHYACFYANEVDVIEILIDKWPESLMSKSTFYGGLPIHAACLRKPIVPQVIQKLVEKAPTSITIQSEKGWLPLDRACDSSIAESVKLINFLSGYQSPFHFACSYSSSLDTLRYLRSHFPDETQSYVDGRLPLHRACRNGIQLDIIRYLVYLFPRATQLVDQSGDLPLHCACRNKMHPEILEYLIKQYPSALHAFSGEDQCLPIHLVCDSGNVKLSSIEFFLRNCPSSIEVASSTGDLPLHCVCRNNCSSEIVEYLIQQYPTAVRRANHKGYLPLHLYLMGDKVEVSVVKFLIQHYPESVELDASGHYALHCYCKSAKAQLGVVQYLFNLYPSAVQARTKNGAWSPLHLAAFTNLDLNLLYFLAMACPEQSDYTIQA